jgi:hypothetical protein
LRKGFVFQRLIIVIYLRIKQEYLYKGRRRERKIRWSLVRLFSPVQKVVFGKKYDVIYFLSAWK